MPQPFTRPTYGTTFISTSTIQKSRICGNSITISALSVRDFVTRKMVFTVLHYLLRIFGRPFVKRFALCYQTVVLSCLSVTLVYCRQTVGWIKLKPGLEVDLGPGDIVLDGIQLPIKRCTAPPLFGPCLLWPNGRPSQLLLCTCVGFSSRCLAQREIIYSLVVLIARRT